MRLPTIAAICLSLLSAVNAADISWNLSPVQTSADGVTFTRAAFTDGEKNYMLSTDSETVAIPSGAGSRFTFKPIASAIFEIQPSPIYPPLPFEAKTFERYKAAARTRIPGGVEAITQMEETPDPLNINSWKSYRVSFAYSQHGRRVRRCVTFLTLQSGQQAMLETSAFDSEFKPAMERSEYLIRSWHELPLKPVTPNS